MKKLIAVGAGAFGIAGVSLAFFGTGVAMADDYAGKSYSDASSAASGAGMKVVVASRNGSLPDAQCTVERSQNAPFVSSTDFSHASNTVQFYLNCNAPFAMPGVAGNSVASPEGRAARQAAEAKLAEAQAAAQQNSESELLDTNNAPGVPGE